MVLHDNLPSMKIIPADLHDSQVQQLLREHLADMYRHSPPGSVYALDLTEFETPEISAYAVWDHHNLMGIGALKELNDSSGEIKSMRTHASHLHNHRIQSVFASGVVTIL